MKIAILGLISPHPGRNRGGTAVSITRLANYLHSRGVEVEVIALASSLDQPLLRNLDPAIGRWPLRRAGRLAILLALVKHVRAYRPDVIISLDTRANTLATRLRRIPGIGPPVMATLRNSVAPRAGHAAIGARRRRALQRIFARADATVAISHGLAREFSATTGAPLERIHVLHNLIVEDDLPERARAPVDHPWVQAGRDAPVVLGIGRLEGQKDFPTLLRAFAALRARRRARLIILGHGDDRPALERLADELGIREDVDFPGFVDNPFAWMARADVFVLSSRWEGFGMVLAEAMAAGCPVVSTDCPSGPREILADGRYGPLVRVGDAAAMAASVEDVLERPPERAILHEGAQRFSVQASGDRYLALARTITAGQAAEPVS